MFWQHFEIFRNSVPSAKASWSIQRCVRWPCLRLETNSWVQAQVSLYKNRRVWTMFSTWDACVCKDFTGEIARVGGEEISPWDQFDTRPTHKPCLNKTYKGTAVTKKTNNNNKATPHLKTCWVSILILNDSQKHLCWKQSLIFHVSFFPAIAKGRSTLRFKSRGVCKNVYIQ